VVNLRDHCHDLPGSIADYKKLDGEGDEGQGSLSKLNQVASFL
jgi:hypothetical protein